MNQYKILAGIIIVAVLLIGIYLFGWMILFMLKLLGSILFFAGALIISILVSVVFIAILAAPFYFVWDLITKK